VAPALAGSAIVTPTASTIRQTFPRHPAQILTLRNAIGNRGVKTFLSRVSGDGTASEVFVLEYPGQRTTTLARVVPGSATVVPGSWQLTKETVLQ
jgi:hypothetical protein